MKRLIFLCFLLLSVGVFFVIKFSNNHSNDHGQAGYSFKGKIKGGSGQKVVLSILVPDPPVYKDIDSVVMDGEEFSLEGKMDEPVFGTLSVHYANGSRRGLGGPFWVENRRIGVWADFT